MWYSPDDHQHNMQLCHHLSCVDIDGLQHALGHAPHIKCPDRSLCFLTDSKRLKFSSPTMSKINGTKYFMVWMESVWECFLVEICNPLTIAICTAIHKMHVDQFVKWILIHTAFPVIQHKEIRILHYAPCNCSCAV